MAEKRPRKFPTAFNARIDCIHAQAEISEEREKGKHTLNTKTESSTRRLNACTYPSTYDHLRGLVAHVETYKNEGTVAFDYIAVRSSYRHSPHKRSNSKSHVK